MQSNHLFLFFFKWLFDIIPGAEDADVSETSRSPARKRPNARADQEKRNKNAAEKRRSKATPPPSAAAPRTPATTVVAQAQNSTAGGQQHLPPSRGDSEQLSAAAQATASSALQKMPGVKFPPALLAANPSLAGAKPGSLVVVASPSKVPAWPFFLSFNEKDFQKE